MRLCCWNLEMKKKILLLKALTKNKIKKCICNKKDFKTLRQLLFIKIFLTFKNFWNLKIINFLFKNFLLENSWTFPYAAQNKNCWSKNWNSIWNQLWDIFPIPHSLFNQICPKHWNIEQTKKKIGKLHASSIHWKYMKNFPNSFSSFVWLYLKLFLMVRKSEHVPYSPKFYLISLNSRIFLRAENFKGNLKLFDYSQWENPLNSPKILYRI